MNEASELTMEPEINKERLFASSPITIDRVMGRGGAFLVTGVDKGKVFSREQFSEDHQMFESAAKDFALNRILPIYKDLNVFNKELSVEIFKEMGELGFLGVDAPEEFGGLGLDKTTSCIVADKLSEGRSASIMVTASAHTGIASLPIIWYGTKEQKEKYLTKMASGEYMACYSLTEPGAGSDALSGKTTATLSEDGKHYLLNGQKIYVTNGAWADVCVTFANVDGQYTAFILDKDCDGWVVGAEEKKMGIKGSSTTTFFFENCKVPIENIQPSEEVSSFLSHEKPPIEDEDYIPATSKELAHAADTIARLVPDSQIGYFYRTINNIKEKVIISPTKPNTTVINTTRGNMLLDPNVPPLNESVNYINTRNYINLRNLDKFRKIIVNKIKIKKNILDNVNQIYKKKFKNYKIVGLHLRGSDMKTTPNHPFPPTLKQATKIIDYLLNNGYQKFFLVTEEYEYFSKLKKIYKNKLLYLETFRTKDNKIFSHDKVRILHRYKLGKEILTEALLLSKCDILVASKTNVILSALMFSNKKKKLLLIDNGLNAKNILLAKFSWEIRKLLPRSVLGLKNKIYVLKA